MVDFNKLKVGDKIISKQDREKTIYTIIKKYGTLLDLEWTINGRTNLYPNYHCSQDVWERDWSYVEINWQERIREGREI